MELHGIKILRISDLRRFFDLQEFWKQKEAFVQQVGCLEKTTFFDTDNERAIFSLLRDWLMSDLEINAKFEEDGTLLVKGTMKDDKIPLGRLSHEISKYQGCIKNKALIGLTLIYLMLDADAPNSDINLQYGEFVALVEGNYLGVDEFVPCREDFEIKQLMYSACPFKRRIIANVNSDKIIQSIGEQTVELRPGDCVVCMIDENQYTRLLPNRITDIDLKITMQMRINTHDKKPYLEIHVGTSGEIIRIDRVCSIAIEEGGYPVYLTMDGELVFDYDKCFKLNTCYTTFKNNYPNAVLLGFEMTDTDGYAFYTDTGKISYE